MDEEKPEQMHKTIAVVAGGYSGEYVVSVESARTIRQHLDPALFVSYTVMITREEWVCLFDDGSQAVVDKNDFSVMRHGKRLEFDCAFITIHGPPGEDGRLQAYFDLLGIPYTTSAVLPSALTANKYFCLMMASHLGLQVAPSVRIRREEKVQVAAMLEKTGLPVFVKPNKGGSSLGTSFVREEEKLLPAMALAFEHDDEVLVEAFVPGTELTCGAIRQNGKVRVLPPTEIVSKTQAGFFDFEAKYTQGAADEITPARVPPALIRQVQEATAFMYDKLELCGMVRVDFIYDGKRLVFLEINTTPGMAATSIVPQQAAMEGISITELFTIVIQEALQTGR